MENGQGDREGSEQRFGSTSISCECGARRRRVVGPGTVLCSSNREWKESVETEWRRLESISETEKRKKGNRGRISAGKANDWIGGENKRNKGSS